MKQFTKILNLAINQLLIFIFSQIYNLIIVFLQLGKFLKTEPAKAGSVLSNFPNQLNIIQEIKNFNESEYYYFLKSPHIQVTSFAADYTQVAETRLHF